MSWLILLLLACVPDDVDTITDDTAAADTGIEDTDTSEAADPQLVGTWVSEGADVSDLFAADPFNYVRIEATFSANGSVEVLAEDTAGTVRSVSGTYTVDTTTTPHGVVVDQTAPYAATSTGIYAISGGELTYEVVQTYPDYGFVPPSDTFGTTGGPGMTAGANVQTYRRD